MHCAPNRCAASLSRSGLRHRGGIERDLVGPGSQQPVYVLRAANAAADRQRDEHLLGRAPDHVVHGLPVVTGRRDVEERQLVGALAIVGRGQLDRIAGVAKIGEVDALDHPAAVDVQARDHAHGDGQARPRLIADPAPGL